MSKIVAICQSSSDYNSDTSVLLDKRQIPLDIEDCPKLIIEFDDLISTCEACEKLSNVRISKEQKKKRKIEFKSFLSKYSQLILAKPSSSSSSSPPLTSSSSSSLATSSRNSSLSSSMSSLTAHHGTEPFRLVAKQSDLANTISQLVTCIGCRTSVDRFYRQLVFNQQQQQHKQQSQENSSNHNSKSLALDPILIDTQTGSLELHSSIVRNPASLYSMFYLTCSKLVDTIPKIKKNRRCHLHSMDTQRHRTLNDWLYIWEALGTDECRLKTISIETKQLLNTLENYLRKHKFCSDCKMKVVKAFNILVGDLDSSKEKGFSASLYQGLEVYSSDSSEPNGLSCSNSTTNGKPNKFVLNREKHQNNMQRIQIKCDRDYVMSLIQKAEPEMQGSRRERHAKTIEIAQEEVLTCIGIYIYDRFHRIYQAMKAEEQTWQILFYASLLTLKKCYEMELENRQGFSKLDLLYAEIAAQDSSEILTSCERAKSARIGQNGKKKSNNKSKRTSLKNSCSLDDSRSNETNWTDRQTEYDQHEENARSDLNDSGMSCTNNSNNEKLVKSESSSKKFDQEKEEENDDEEEIGFVEDEVDEENEHNYELDDFIQKQQVHENDVEDEEEVNDDDHHHVDNDDDDDEDDDEVEKEFLTTSSCSPLSQSSSSFNSSKGMVHQVSLTPECCKCSTSVIDLDFEAYTQSHLNYENDDANENAANNFMMITEEEKNEYYANKSILLSKRHHRREILLQKFQNFKLNANNFKFRPRERLCN